MPSKNHKMNLIFIRKADLVLIFSLLKISFLYAQIDNRKLELVSELDSSKIKKVQFSFSSINYLKNNEYFNQMVDGYTLFGVYVNPQVKYQLTKKVLLEGGVFLDKTFGKSGLHAIEPTFSIKYQTDNWRLNFGNLEANVAHRMIEPLINFEQIIRDPLEYGVQAKYQKNDIFFDTWLDWQKSTIAGEAGQEHILFGVNYMGKKFKIQGTRVRENQPETGNQKLRLQPILQLTAFHQGGQNTTGDLPVLTFMNLAAGLNFGKTINPKWNLSFEPYFVGYVENKNTGKAAYLNLKLESKNTKFYLNYWNGNNYISPMGGDLFQSVSRKFGNENYTEKVRKLLIFRFIKEWELVENLNLSFRFEPHFDLKNQIFEHSEGLYLRLKI